VRAIPPLIALLAAATWRLAHGAQCGAMAPAEAPAAAAFTWQALPASEAAPAPAPYRIGVWGDSLTSARNFFDAALLASGIGRTAVLPSFIQAGVGVASLALPLKASCAGPGWHTAYAYRAKGEAPAFSLGLVSMEAGSPGATLALDFRFPLADTRVRQLDILYDKATPDGSLLLAVSLDGQEEQLIPLSRAAGGVLRIAPPTPIARLRLRLVAGQIRLHGFLPQYAAAPRVVLDTLSIPGALLRGWQQVEPAVLPGMPVYDLIVLQYGTNEGASPAFDAAGYASYLRASLARVRQLQPQARCILIGPPDRGVTSAPAADPMRYSAIHRQIARAQKEVGAQFRCAFWDWQGETGGPGTALRWARASPPLMQPDLTHMTAQGYEASGRMFARSHRIAIPQH
jgi:lysophospholipase L1-like esterase